MRTGEQRIRGSRFLLERGDEGGGVTGSAGPVGAIGGEVAVRGDAMVNFGGGDEESSVGFEFFGGDFEDGRGDLGKFDGGVDLAGCFEETLDAGELLLEFDYVVDEAIGYTETG